MELENETLDDISTESMRTHASKNQRFSTKSSRFSTLTMPWTLMGRQFPRSEIVFFSQMTIIVCVIVASIYNLSSSQENRSLWITLLSSSLGYVLPNPSIDRRSARERLY